MNTFYLSCQIFSFDVNRERNSDGDLLIHVAVKGGRTERERERERCKESTNVQICIFVYFIFLSFPISTRRPAPAASVVCSGVHLQS